MPKMLSITIITTLLLFITQHQCKDCLWLSQYLCGNECLSLNSTCYCGRNSITFREAGNYSCCANKDCEKQLNGDILCTHATKQRWNYTCNGHCNQLASYGFDTQKCSNENTCYIKVEACRGKNYCNDTESQSSCSSPKGNPWNCKSQWDSEDCGQLQNAKYKNYGCKHVNSEAFDHFECANRKDKENVLFDRPTVPTKTSKQAINYNIVLDFNETHINCGGNNIFEYIDFDDMRKEHNGQDRCQLLDGRSVNLQILWVELLQDYSFEFDNLTEQYL